MRGVFQIFELILFTLVGGTFLVAESMVMGIRPLENAILRAWGRAQLVMAGVRVELRGAENIPPEGCLFLFNHMSYSDIYVTFGHIPRPFRFGAKIELFRIPVFGRAMRSVGVLPIVRHDRQEVLRVYEQAIARVHRGECFALAPEGTRQEQPKLGKFKLGPFIFAINAQMPMVPVLMAGTHRVQPKGAWWMNVGAWRRTVILQILPPIATRGFASAQARELSEQTYAVMERAHARLFDEYDERFGAAQCNNVPAGR